jgi:hypothetical protein
MHPHHKSILSDSLGEQTASGTLELFSIEDILWVWKPVWMLDMKWMEDCIGDIDN